MPSGEWYARADKESNDDLREYYTTLHAPILSLGNAHKKFFELNPQPQGTLLDVGCGNGGFVKEASKMLEAYGIDFDARSVEAAKKAGVKNVFTLSLTDFSAKMKGKKFDYVTFFEVLEHQTAPVQFISEVKALLNKGGLIAGSVPSHNRIEPCEEGDKPPNHFLLFTKDGLVHFLESQGFSEIVVEEIFGPQELRVAVGFTSRTLRSLFGVEETDISQNSLKYAAYSVAKKIGKFFVPILNAASWVYINIVGKERVEKIRKESITYRALYFQARLK